jgi:pyruvate formate lyase activating enzyme
MKEAMFYEKIAGGDVSCGLCRFRCHIAQGKRGICGVRENSGGVLYSLVYGKAVARQVDPIEKKPLFHFRPGSKSYSIATVGCNFRCRHCQNYQISKAPMDGFQITGPQFPPEEIVLNAVASGCSSVSYTYTEPTIFYEYAFETAVLAKEAGLGNVFVTNGYITREALVHISPYLDAANIDLKGFSEYFYREVVHARLGEVKDSIIEYKKQGIWIELTTLIIPDMNDSDRELEEIARFIVENLGSDTPWHVSQFYPTHELTDKPRTPVSTLRRAREIGLNAGLHYVYEGNVPGDGGENSFCPGCGNTVVRRHGYLILENKIEGGRCPFCAGTIAGIFSK